MATTPTCVPTIFQIWMRHRDDILEFLILKDKLAMFTVHSRMYHAGYKSLALDIISTMAEYESQWHCGCVCGDCVSKISNQHWSSISVLKKVSIAQTGKLQLCGATRRILHEGIMLMTPHDSLSLENDRNIRDFCNGVLHVLLVYIIHHNIWHMQAKEDIILSFLDKYFFALFQYDGVLLMS